MGMFTQVAVDVDVGAGTQGSSNLAASERTALVSTILTAFLIWCSRTQLPSCSPMRSIQALKELPDAEHDLSVSGTIGERPVITVRSRPLWG